MGPATVNVPATRRHVRYDRNICTSNVCNYEENGRVAGLWGGGAGSGEAEGRAWRRALTLHTVFTGISRVASQANDRLTITYLHYHHRIRILHNSPNLSV